MDRDILKLKMQNNIAYMTPYAERITRGLCMLGNIYTRQRCQVCGSKMTHDERRKGCFCFDHPDFPAVKEFFVKFPSSPPIYRRFNSDYGAAARFLNGLRFKRDEGTLDPRDYRVDNPLGFANQVETWLSVKRRHGLNKTTVSNLEREIGRAVDCWQNRNVKTIGTAEIEDFLLSDHKSARTGEPISSKTRANLRSTIHQFWAWLCRREKGIDMPDIPELAYELGWRTVVDVVTQQAIIERVREISWHVSPKIWLGIHILSHNPEVRPGELLQVVEQDILVDHAIIMIKWPKEGTLKGKHAHLWPEEIEVLRSFPSSIPTVPFFRHPKGVSGIKAGAPFGATYFNKWVNKACDSLSVQRIGVYALVKHSTMTALSTELTPEQIRRGGSKHTSRAMERYLLPEIGETRLVQDTIKKMRQAAEVITIDRNQGATKKRGS